MGHIFNFFNSHEINNFILHLVTLIVVIIITISLKYDLETRLGESMQNPIILHFVYDIFDTNFT